MGKAVSGITDAVGLTDSRGAEKAMKNATSEQRAILARLDQIDLPDIEKMKIALETPELVDLLEAEAAPESEFLNIEEDPRLRADQLDALAGLRERAETGLTEEDRFNIEELIGDVGAQEMAQRRSIEQEMARRGMADSGTSLAAKLSAAQSGANRGRQEALNIGAQSAQQRQSALANLANAAGTMSQRDLNLQSQTASARDAIAQANARNRQNVAQTNLAARQAIENQRAQLSNQQQMYNRGLEQQQFQNRMAKAGAQNQAQSGIASTYAQQAQSKAAADANMFGTLGGLGAAAISSDKNLKINVESGDDKVKDMLNKLEPYQYDYKDEAPVMEKEDQLGIMAQDLEKSPLGEEFVEEDMQGNKLVNYGKMGSTQLAASANLNKRLSKIEDLMKRLGIDTEDL